MIELWEKCKVRFNDYLKWCQIREQRNYFAGLCLIVTLLRQTQSVSQSLLVGELWGGPRNVVVMVLFSCVVRAACILPIL